MKFRFLFLLSLFTLFISGCLTPSATERQYIVGHVVKTAGGIDTFREPGFVELKDPSEGYDKSSAVRAVVKVSYKEDGSVDVLKDLRVSDKKYEALVRTFLNTLKAEKSSIDDLNGLEHDFRVWVYENTVVHIESSR